jgi:hypothetical protein
MLAAGAIVALAAGCGSYSDQTPTAGVDELVIPTPSPDPDDFVPTIDNPWLPFAPGARWTYDGSGEEVTVSADAGPTISGVATTVVTTDGLDPVSLIDYYAQDTAGNVWWFGREGEWEAGAAGQRSLIKELGDELVIETTTETGDVVTDHYERGTGLVQRDDGDMELGLAAYDEPQS